MENTEIKITVITTVYNREDCIRMCIESVMRQQNIHHVIVNDG